MNVIAKLEQKMGRERANRVATYVKTKRSKGSDNTATDIEAQK